jgi:hypothetical protein
MRTDWLQVSLRLDCRPSDSRERSERSSLKQKVVARGSRGEKRPHSVSSNSPSIQLKFIVAVGANPSVGDACTVPKSKEFLYKHGLIGSAEFVVARHWPDNVISSLGSCLLKQGI